MFIKKPLFMTTDEESSTGGSVDNPAENNDGNEAVNDEVSEDIVLSAEYAASLRDSIASLMAENESLKASIDSLSKTVEDETASKNEMFDRFFYGEKKVSEAVKSEPTAEKPVDLPSVPQFDTNDIIERMAANAARSENQRRNN